MNPEPSTQIALDVADRVRRILMTRNLTLAEASRHSLRTFPSDSRYHIPHNLYYDLRTALFSPNIFQVFALSVITGYRLSDWLAVFGFHLEDIPRLQIAIPSLRTALLDTAVVDTEAWIPWFVETGEGLPRVAPASQILRFSELRQVRSLPGQSPGYFLYVKIGRQDAFAYPDLLPESVARIDTRRPERHLPAAPGEVSRVLFLVEHAKGLLCCRLRRTDELRVTLHSSETPYAEVSMQLGLQLRLLGAVDLEIRRLDLRSTPEVPEEFASFWSPGSLPTGRRLRLGELLRTCRLRSGTPFRSASARSLLIAKELGDTRFSIASSSLSDYETSDDPPRHIHKILSLCILYSVPFVTILDTIGFRLEQTGGDSIPEQLLPRGRAGDSLPRCETITELRPGGILEHVVAELQEIPYFLRGSLAELSEVAALSLRDIFWIGGKRISRHPYLRNALLVVVNRSFKRPRPTHLRPLWQQPLYVLMKRDGSYILGRCSVEGSFLVVHPSSNGMLASEQFQNRVDAEVVGRVVSIVRRVISDA